MLESSRGGRVRLFSGLVLGCGCSWLCCEGSLALGLLPVVVVSHPVRESVSVVGADLAIKGY